MYVRTCVLAHISINISGLDEIKFPNSSKYGTLMLLNLLLFFLNKKKEGWFFCLFDSSTYCMVFEENWVLAQFITVLTTELINLTFNFNRIKGWWNIQLQFWYIFDAYLKKKNSIIKIYFWVYLHLFNNCKI